MTTSAHIAMTARQAPAQSRPQARARSRAAAAVLLRQFAAGAVRAVARAVPAGGAPHRRARRHLRRHRRVHAGGADRARDRLCADAASAGHAAGHRGHRGGVRRADALPAGRDLHQAQADHHLRAVRRRAARRARVRQAAARRWCSIRSSISPTKAGASSRCAGRCSSSRSRSSTRSSGARSRPTSGSASRCSASLPLTFVFAAAAISAADRNTPRRSEGRLRTRHARYWRRQRLLDRRLAAPFPDCPA